MSDPGAVHQIPTGEKAEADFLEQLHQILVASNFLWTACTASGRCAVKREAGSPGLGMAALALPTF